MSTDNNRREPVLRGGIYCSPACGCRCTYAAWRLATENGNDLVKRMGSGWELKVWENMGWHYRVRKGGCLLHANTHGDTTAYTAYFNTATQFVHTSDTPETAVVMAAMAAVEHVHIITADLAVLNTLEETE